MDETLSVQGKRSYQVLACTAQESLALRLTAAHPQRFTYHPSVWRKFNDGTDRIELGGYTPTNQLRGQHVLFLASFADNDTTLSQFHALIVLLESFIASLTVVLPFYPTATMERVTHEGTVATASTMARLFNALPSCGAPTCLVLYDLHSLQNRFYFSGTCLAQLESTVPLLHAALSQPLGLVSTNGTTAATAAAAAAAAADSLPSCPPVDMIAFPDDGAAKRFASLFPGYPVVICGKHRGEGDQRVVVIQDGDPSPAKHVLIVDDLVQSGGTLYECGMALKAAGAPLVSAFVAHAVFPKDTWRKFCRRPPPLRSPPASPAAAATTAASAAAPAAAAAADANGAVGNSAGTSVPVEAAASSAGSAGDWAIFERFWVTNSIPGTTSRLPKDDAFVVLDIMPKIAADLC